jgi:mRNA-degrading endonuclease toxin of MazEF toxin-antitoxin module
VKQGEIWHLDLEPTKGREQRGRRYVLIVSADKFNRLTGMPVVCPITTVGNASRFRGFAVNLQGGGTGVTGVVQCEQPRVVDILQRGGKYSGERVTPALMGEVLAVTAAIYGIE